MPKVLESDERYILDKFPPSKALWDQIRGAFIAKGTSLSKWIEESGTTMNSVRMAIHGLMDGKKGKQLRIDAIKASGLLENKSND